MRSGLHRLGFLRLNQIRSSTKGFGVRTWWIVRRSGQFTSTLRHGLFVYRFEDRAFLEAQRGGLAFRTGCL